MSRISHNMKWGGAVPKLALLLGLFLLAAAGLKVHGLIVDPYGQENFLALPWLQVLTIEVEVLLGLWLLSRMQPQLAWYVTLLFFIALASISFTLAWQGQSSCGCFGKVEVNPWYTFALDAGIVITMVCLIPLSLPGRGARGEGFLSGAAPSQVGAEEPGATPLRPIFQVACTTLALLGLIALGFTLFTKDPWATLARLRGETLAVNPPVTQLGEGIAGEQRTFKVELRNYSDKPIKVVGGTTSCSCIATHDLPLIIKGGETMQLSITIRFTGTTGRFTHHFVLHSDGFVANATARFTGTVSAVAKLDPPALSQSGKEQLLEY